MGLRTKTENNATSSNHTMRIQIGDICCAIRCHDGEVFGRLGELYGNFLSDGPADITIELDIVERLSVSKTELALSRGRVIWGGDHVAALYQPGRSAPNGHSYRVTVEKYQFHPRHEFKIMNLLLPPLYYTAYRMKHHDAQFPGMLVHSCCILRRGRALLFAGPSETGKTTVARLCGNEHGQVINDEMLLVSRSGWDGGMMTVQGVPILGGVAQRLNVMAPLACVLLLKQAGRTTLRRLDRLDAYLRLLRQVIAPRDLDSGHIDTRAMLLQTSRFSDWITNTVPCYELQFTLDRERLWGAVAELEESIIKGELVA